MSKERRGFQVAAVILVASLASGCAWIARVTVDTSGGDSNGGSFEPPSISADGRYVAFRSSASDLVPDDRNLQDDVFVRDLLLRTTVRVSVDTAGGDANDDNFSPAISADGRYVAFISWASDLVANDGTGGPGTGDVFVRDLAAATTTRVSVSSTGGDPNGESGDPSISADGLLVGFRSKASDLVSYDGNSFLDVFVRDWQSGSTTRVSVDTAGGDANGHSFSSSLSSDGRYVAFNSEASDLVSDDAQSFSDVFVRDLQTGTTTRASVDTSGGDPNALSGLPSISADGRYVAFSSRASDLVSGDGNLQDDVFVRDRQAGTTIRASVDDVGGDGDGRSYDPSLSADGHYVAFESTATDLVASDGNHENDVFMRDLKAETTVRASVNGTGGEANFGGHSPSLSRDGRYVAFVSASTNLVPGNDEPLDDVIVRALKPPAVTSIAPSTVARGATANLTLTGSGFLPDAQASFAILGSGGVTVNSINVMSGTQLNVSVRVDGDAPTGARHLFVWNRGTGPGPMATAVGFCGNCLTVT